MDPEGGEQAGRDHCKADAEDHEGSAVADAGDQLAGADRGHDDWQHQGKEVDAALDGRVALHSMKPDGKVVYWHFGISKGKFRLSKCI